MASSSSRQLEAEVDDAEGTLAIWAYDTHKLPICPLYYDRVLAHDDPVLERLGDCSPTCRLAAAGGRTRAALKAELASLVRDSMRPAATALDGAGQRR